jgi:hypothetical protein
MFTRINTKDKRDETRNYLFNKHIADGFTQETYKSLEIFTKADSNGKFYLHLYVGNSTKDINKYYYRDAERLAAAVQSAKEQHDRNTEYKANKIKNYKLTAAEAEKKAAAGEVVQASTRKSTVLLKKYIREKWGIDCAVRSETYSGGCSLNISYTLGPDEEQLNEIEAALQYGRFDGMTDYSYNVDVSGIVVDGFKLAEFKHVFIKQDISHELIKKCALMLSDAKMFNVPDLLPDFSNYQTNFDEIYNSAWTWTQLIYQQFKIRNFVTQDENKIKLLSCNHDFDSFHSDVYFIYEVDGVQYDTRTYKTETKPAEAAKTSEKSNFEAVEVEAGKINIIDYSEKAIAIIGDTKPIKEILKALGGRFNFRLSCGAGWIFPKTMQGKVIEAIKEATIKNKQEAQAEVKEEIQKTVEFKKDTDVQLYGEVQTDTKQIKNKYDVNNVKEYDNIKDIEAAAESGQVISLLNLYNLVNNKSAAL